MKKTILLLLCFLLTYNFCNSQVIDMHMHSYTDKDFFTGIARNGLASSKTAKENLQQTILKMDQNNIKYAVICGRMESIAFYTSADKRFIPAYQDYDDTLLDIQKFEEYVKTEK